MAQQSHPIFGDIVRGRLEEVQRRVRADAAVLEERWALYAMTPLTWAVFMRKQPAIALWLIEHRGQHDLDSTNNYGRTALHWACIYGPLSVVTALVLAGANPAVVDCNGETPLIYAAYINHANIVAFVLQQPAVKASIDAVTSRLPCTGLSIASYRGHLSIVQLLLDAGADPTIPAGQHSPLSRATHHGHTAVAALLRTAIAEPQRPRFLLKARALLDVALAVPKARKDAADKGEPQAMQQQQQEAIAAAPAYLKGRVAEGRALPAVVVVDDSHWRSDNDKEEELVACVKYALGLEGGGDVHEEGKGPPPQGMVHDVFIELCELLVPTWDRASV